MGQQDGYSSFRIRSKASKSFFGFDSLVQRVCGRVLSECASLFQTAVNLDILCSHTDIQDILDILKIQEILFVLDILDILDITIPDGWASLFQTAANLARMADPQHSFAPLLHHIT